MDAVYKLNTRELSPGFIGSLCKIYPDHDIEITVRGAEDFMDGGDATEYLQKAVEDVNLRRNLISFDTVEDAVRYAGEAAGVERELAAQ